MLAILLTWLSKDFKPHYNRITFTSPLAKGLFDKWNWFFDKETKIYVNSNIEPLQIGFYELNISAGGYYADTRYFLIGQTLSGRILSEDECREILNLPVADIEKGEIEYGQSEFSMQYMGIGNLDFKIDNDKIIEDYILSKKGSFAYEVEKIKMLAGRKKANLELHLKDLKTEIEELKKKLNNKLSDRLEELQITKQLKVLENDLRKQENDLFFDMAQVDVDTENEIKQLTEKTRFRVRPTSYFKLHFEPKAEVQEILEEVSEDSLDRYRIR